MKAISKLKLNVLSQANLLEREMNALKGGAHCCTCSCYYANSGGSSSEDNAAANYRIAPGAGSTTGDNEYAYSGGGGY
jgi:natural product precursor